MISIRVDRVEQELAAIPGVSGVATSLVPVLSGSNWGSDVAVEGFKKDADTDANSRFNEISAGYFRVMGVPLMAGREFTKSDFVGAPKVMGAYGGPSRVMALCQR